MKMEPVMKDSGTRRQFETGAVRDRGTFKPRPDLISPHANLREGAWLAKGAEKYEVDNWAKGMPIRECVASLSRHLEAYKLGLKDEDHMAAIRTNAGFILHFEEEIKAGRLSPSLDDMPKYSQRPVLGIAHFVEPLALPAETAPPISAEWLSAIRRRATESDPRHHLMVAEALDAFKVEPPHGWQKPFTVYLCGPITGRAIDYNWREAAAGMLAEHGIKTLDPLRGKKPEDVSNLGLSYKGQLAAPEIAERDRMDIEEADAVLAHFPYEPPRQSIGSLMEMGAAAIGFKKPVILCTDVKVFSTHLFCRNFCTLEPDFHQAIQRLVALSHVHQEKR